MARAMFLAYIAETFAGLLVTHYRVPNLLARGAITDDRTEAAGEAALSAYFTGLVILNVAIPARSAALANAACLVLFVLGQLLDGWAVWALGERWCRRIVVLPGVPRVERGPYRFLRHPIYVATVIEWFALPGIAGHAWFGAVAATGVALLLRRRAQVEDELLGRISRDL